MNTRPHCRTSPPTGIGGQGMPGGITTNSRTGFAASRPSAGSRIPSANCWISPGATMPEPIGSAAGPQTDDRRTARMGLVGDGRAASVRNVAADHQALAPSAPSSCRSDDALVFARIDRLVGLDIIVALAVAVGVKNERRPALGFLLIAGFFEHFAIEPADDRRLRAAGAGP